MTRLVLALIRFVALCLSFLLSTFAAAAFMTFALFLGGDSAWLKDDPAVAIGSIGFLIGVWVEICRALFAPFLLIMLVAELSRLDSLTFNMVGGGILAVIYMVLLPYAHDLPYSAREVWLVALAAGFVGGLVHWMLAGHRAGRWLGPRAG